MSWNRFITRRVILAAILVVAAVGGLIATHRAAYQRGLLNGKQQVATVVEACHSGETSLALNLSIMALKAAIKNPASFDRQDLNYFIRIAQNAADDMEKIIPRMHETAVAERQRDPEHADSEEDVQQSIEYARRRIQEARKLANQLARK